MSLIDRRLINIRITVEKVANEPAENPATGIQYIVGSEGTGAFEGIAPNSIACFDGANWKFAAPSAFSMEVFNLETGQLLRYNGTDWVAVVTIPDADNIPATPTTETHSLTKSEASAKSFTLSQSVAEGQEDNVLLFISGVAQIAGTDFSVSGNSISWSDKALDNIKLVEGDVFLIHYIAA